MAKTMQPLLLNGEQVYIDLDCGETMTWGAVEKSNMGSIEDQGCDRCESSLARWVKVWVEQ